MQTNEFLTNWYLQNYSVVINIAFSFAPSPEHVNDIIQSTYIEFIRDADGTTGTQDLIQILRRVAHRVAQRFWDERNRNTPEKLQKIGLHLARLAQERFAEKVFEDDLFALRACLDKLPEKSRKLIEERYFMDNSVHSIAKRFNMASSTVYKAICIIRNKLRQCVERALEQEDSYAN